MQSGHSPKQPPAGRYAGLILAGILATLLLMPICATAADNGFIAVQSVPDGARIFVDDVYQGISPWKGIFAPGGHTLKCTHAGYEDFETSFVLHPLESKAFDCIMVPLPATGIITVTSTPSDSRVLVDEVMVGLTPHSGEYAPGVHTVKVTKNGYKDYETSVTVETGKTVEVNAGLISVPQTGTVSVFSTPTGATVVFDGVSYGPAPVTATLDPGQHSLTVSKPGYNDYVAVVSVSTGETVPVYVTLTGGTLKATPVPLIATTPAVTAAATQAATAGRGEGTGSLYLTSRPDGANVYVNGAFIGKTPAGVRSVATGTHTVLFTLNGYEDFSTTVMVTSDETAEFTARLDPVADNGTPVPATTKASGAGAALVVMALAGFVLIQKRE